MLLLHAAECIGIMGGTGSYCARSNDVWALGVILTSMISGHNPWRRADLTDDCFRTYVNNPGFFRDMLPVSPAADAILRRIFTNDDKRVSLSKLRRLILDVETFFMSDEEIACSNMYVQMAAVSYLRDPLSPSSSNGRKLSRNVHEVTHAAQGASCHEKAKHWLEKAAPEEMDMSPVISRLRTTVADRPTSEVYSRSTTLDSSVRSNTENYSPRGILKRTLPPPQPMPSRHTLLQLSADSIHPPSSSRSRFSKSRRVCGSDSPVGLLRRLMDRIFV